MQDSYRYFAFISYNSKDTDWGKKLQKKLEHYRMPATLCSEHGWKRKPINPVFFAPTDIQPGGLSEELQNRLRSARHLIVICSPNSAKSEWVGKEIEFFHSLGRANNIHFFIVEGTPHSGDPETECFNPVIDKLGLPEILGANIHEKVYRQPWLNKERAYVQLISKLMGVEFDAIWQRHKKRLMKIVALWCAAGMAVITAILCAWRISQPFDVEFKLNEASFHNDNLPPLKNALVTMFLDNETKSDTLHSFDDRLIFNNIPHKLKNKPIQITATCKDFHDLDTVVTLSSSISLNFYRDPMVYGDVHFCTWNPETETRKIHDTLYVDGNEVITDDKGCASLFIPLERQKTVYPVSASFPLKDHFITMPSGKDDVIRTE